MATATPWWSGLFGTPKAGSSVETSGGFFDRLQTGFADNSNALGALGLGLLAHRQNAVANPLGNAIQPFMMGGQIDAKERLAKQEEAEKQAEVSRTVAFLASKGLGSEDHLKGLPKAVLQEMLAGIFKEPAKPETLTLSPGERAYQNGQMIAENPVLPGSNLTADQQNAAHRQQMADQYGLTGAAKQSYILTGKLPGAEGLTAVEQKAVLDADETAAAAQEVTNLLDKAIDLNSKSLSGPGASQRANLATSMPDAWLPGDRQAALNTRDLDNIVTSQALASLKVIFGGNPTEAENRILREVSGSVNLPAETRKQIYDRAKEAANRRIAINKQKAEQLRSGTYFAPGGGAALSDGYKIIGVE